MLHSHMPYGLQEKGDFHYGLSLCACVRACVCVWSTLVKSEIVFMLAMVWPLWSLCFANLVLGTFWGQVGEVNLNSALIHSIWFVYSDSIKPPPWMVSLQQEHVVMKAVLCRDMRVAVLSALGYWGQPVFAVQRGGDFIKIGPRGNICWGHGIKDKRNPLFPT